MKSINSVLKAGQAADEIRAVNAPAAVPVMQQALPPNLGPRTKAILAETQPAGHYALMDTGALTYIRDGEALDDPKAINDEGVLGELAKGYPVIVYGLGAGQLVTRVRSLSERARGGRAAPILVYEPDPQTLAAFMGLGLPMQGVSIACDLEDWRAMFATFLQGRTAISVFHNAFTLARYGVERFESFMDVTRRIADAEQVTMNTINVRMPEWIRHVSQNAEQIIGTRPLMALANEFTGMPAFIVGAGPSIERNGHLLSECYRKGIVFTIDVAGRLFARYGAEPHVFVAVEGADLSEHLKGVDWIDHVPRAFSLEASPAVLRTGKGPLLPWADSNHSFNDINHALLGVEGLPIGGSVTTAAFLMAEMMGCGPIIMVGQDLANTGGKRAAAGVLADRLAVLSPHGTVRRWGQDESYYNERSRCRYWDLLTDTPQWLHARVWFEQRASWLKANKPQVQLLNCTEGGSHVEGFDDIELAHVLAQLPDREVDIMGRLEGVQPIWAEGVAWWRKRQLDTLRPIGPAARAMAERVRSIGDMIAANAPMPSVQAAMQERAQMEENFRKVSGVQSLFVGAVQFQLKELNEIREEATVKGKEGKDAAAFFHAEAKIFDALADKADELVEAMEVE